VKYAIERNRVGRAYFVGVTRTGQSVRFELGCHSIRANVYLAESIAAAFDFKGYRPTIDPKAADKSIPLLISNYTYELFERKRSRLTTWRYRNELRFLGRHCYWPTLSAVSRKSFLTWRRSTNIHPGRIDRLLRHYRTFLDWLCLTFQLELNPLRRIPLLEGEK
jgi:hypothetical protein